MPVKFADTLPTYTIPSKHDIIPVHASDRGTFKYCRRKWKWSSPSQLNLVPRIEVVGITEPLWFGTGIHHALEQYYSPVREDPEVAWTTWFNLQWNGGLVHVNDLRSFSDREPQRTSDPDIYLVQGLEELLPVADVEHFMQVLDLGQGMMRYYKEYAEEHDNFTVVATEHDFSVPILDPNGDPLYMVDKRRMPEGWEPNFELENEFGPIMKMVPYYWAPGHRGEDVLVKQCHARGRMDMILQDNESGRYGIKDYKTASSIGDDYFAHLDLDEQATTYLTLGEVEAIIYDLPYKSLEFIIYEAILKGYPKPPTITSRGLPSINRNEETTTAELFAKAVNSNPATKIIFDKDPKMQAYYQYLIETESTRFINRQSRWRNSAQRINARIRLYHEAVDMLSDPVCYPTPRKEYGCIRCAFRTPCLMAEDGSDYRETLEMSYISNWDR